MSPWQRLNWLRKRVNVSTLSHQAASLLADDPSAPVDGELGKPPTPRQRLRWLRRHISSANLTRWAQTQTRWAQTQAGVMGRRFLDANLTHWAHARASEVGTTLASARDGALRGGQAAWQRRDQLWHRATAWADAKVVQLLPPVLRQRAWAAIEPWSRDRRAHVVAAVLACLMLGCCCCRCCVSPCMRRRTRRHSAYTALEGDPFVITSRAETEDTDSGDDGRQTP